MLKKINKIIFSRTFFFGSIILLQLGLFTFLIQTLSQQGAEIYTMMMFLSALIVVWLFGGDLNPAYKMVWALILFIFPLLGGFYFLLWKQIKLPKKLRKLLFRIYQQTNDLNVQDPLLMEQLEAISPSQARQAQQLLEMAAAPLMENKSAKYYSMGEAWFADFKLDLQKAEHYIFLEFYIIRPGRMMDELLEILEAKIKSGVEVKLLYDDIGTILLVPGDYLQTLQRRGIDAHLFNPLTPWLDGFINSRDHRKIAVIDGKIAFNGGCNIGDEYINRVSPFGQWKDTMVRLEGPAAWSFTLLFLQAWYFTTGQPINWRTYKASVPAHIEAMPRDGFVQPFGSNPMTHSNVAANSYLNIINRSTDYLYITTPYLILGNELTTALCLAASSGIDVRLITPGISDNKIIFWLTQSYYPVLMQAGVKIYEYTPGFMHAKMFISDDQTAVVGSANLDFRSLFLLFESCTQFYQASLISEIKADFLECLAKSEQITADRLARAPRVKRIIQSILRVFAPLL